MMGHFWCKAALVSVGLLMGCNVAEGARPEGPRLAASLGVRKSTQTAEAPRFPGKLRIPIQDFFPEGIAHAADGTFYVGSYSTGVVLRQRPGAHQMEPFLPANGRAIAGMKVQDSTNTLWLCELDLTWTTPGGLKAYDLATGSLRGSWPFPLEGGCNDLTLDAHGNVYATDSFLGVVRRLKKGASQLETWASDPERFMAPPGYPGLNGIAWGDGAIYVVKYDSGELFHIGINPNGSAGTITRITTDASLGYPDGILMLAPGVLLVVDNDNGQFKRVDLSGDMGHVSLLATGFDNPTTVALHDGDAFIVESQFDHFFGIDRTPADVPFVVKRVWLR
jgi:sugar lactone lactonase YvrE